MDGYVGLDWLILIVSFAISLGTQAYINGKYNKSRKIETNKGLKGWEVARKILNDNNLGDIEIFESSGMLSDHYDPRKRIIKLSDDVYNGSSVASCAVAAHECGHAIQDKEGYFFLKLRSAFVPFVNVASYVGYFAILIGLFLGALGFITFGIICEAIILIFQLITLPVEFNASHRALEELKENSILNDNELEKSRGMLVAAALTYVASVATSILQIVRLLLIARRRND